MTVYEEATKVEIGAGIRVVFSIHGWVHNSIYVRVWSFTIDMELLRVSERSGKWANPSVRRESRHAVYPLMVP